MAWTKHGHHISGSVLSDDDLPIARMRCGGPGLCNACSKEASMYHNLANKKKNINDVVEAETPDDNKLAQNDSISLSTSKDDNA